MTDLKNKTRVALIRAWTVGLLHEREPIVLADSLEDDGRKQQKTIKTLIAEGYLTRDESHKPNPRLLATSKAYDAIPAAKIEVTIAKDVINAWDLNRCYGIAWEDLSSEGRKYVMENRAEFSLVDVDRYNNTETPFNPNDPNRSFERRTLYVRDAAYLADKAKRIYDAQFDQAFKANLAWGLKKLGIIEEVDADVFKAREDNNPMVGFGSFSSMTFGADPAKWGTDLKTSVEELRERIAKATRKANVLLAAEGKILAMGGWPVVLEKYSVLLTEALAKRTAKEKAEAQAEADTKADPHAGELPEPAHTH